MHPSLYRVDLQLRCVRINQTNEQIQHDTGEDRAIERWYCIDCEPPHSPFGVVRHERHIFDLLYAEGEDVPSMMSIGLHDRLVGRPARAAGLIRLLDHVRIER